MFQVPQARAHAEVLLVKLVVAAVTGQTVAACKIGNSPTQASKFPQGLIGKVNEAQIQIEEVECTGLVDTGSMVSTVSERFFQENLKNIPLHPLEALLKIECAAGQHLPYAGYIEVGLRIPGRGISEMCLFLVVPETGYSANVPVLVGTNILTPLRDRCRHRYGPRFLQKAVLDTPWWLAFHHLGVQEQQQGQVTLLMCAAKTPIRVPPGGRVAVPVRARGKKSKDCLMMIHPTKEADLPEGVEITQATLKGAGQSGQLKVEVTNFCSVPVMIRPRTVIGELQQVSAAHRSATGNGKCIQEPVKTDKEFLKSFNLHETELSKEQILEVHKLLLQFRDVFSEGEFDIGHTTTVKHRIDLVDETPFKQRHRRIPPAMYDEVREHLRQLQEVGIIRRSSSPFASPVVLVRKKNGALRFCVDYRMLNNRMVKDLYALPRIEELMDNFAGCQYFSSLDMRSGYYQVEIEESHKERTAFTVGPLGFWEFNRMAFGLSTSPATFSRLMEFVMGDLHMKECFTFLDDCNVPGKDFAEEMHRLEHVFQKLREHRLKLNAGKCRLFRTWVKYCGHIISKDGIETDPEKIKKITNWPIPQNVAQVREFAGFAGYYRRFVKKFSQIARPLNELLGGPKRKRGKAKTGKGKPASERQKPPEWKWEKAQQEAFETLKRCLSTPPVLAYADYDLPFILYTDASGKGLGAVLSQEQKGQERVIAYASRGLSPSERNYPVHKLEFLALKWAVTEKFADYLYGAKCKFTIYTDNNPLTYVQTTAKLDVPSHRWLAGLAAFNFDIIYRSGKSNVNADILSRLPGNAVNQAGECHTIEHETIAAIHQVCSTRVPLVEMLCMAGQVLDMDGLQVDTTVGLREVRKSQRDDSVIGPLMKLVSQGKRPKLTGLGPGTEAHRLAKEFDQLQIKRGLLYRVTEVDGQERLQVVMPQEYRELVLTGLHDNAGHQGRDRTLSLIQDRFYWPGMAAQVDAKVRTCERCI